MLHKQKMMQLLHSYIPHVFKTADTQYKKAFELFMQLLSDQTVQEKVTLMRSLHKLPSWLEPLEATHFITPQTTQYRVLSTDGSQIYPDRHQGFTCYLINIGVVDITYQPHNSSIYLDAIPYIEQLPENQLNEQLISIRRGVYELRSLIEYYKKTPSHHRTIAIVDGPLLLSHIDPEDEIQREYYDQSIELYQEAADIGLPLIGYVSLPRSRELIKLLQVIDREVPLTSLVDTDVMTDLDIYHRFACFSYALTTSYPSEATPYFTYVHTGSEIARIELPRWVYEDELLRNFAFSVVLDQCIKGQGYPVVISEAHEQAVIDAQDRELFFTMLQKLYIEKTQAYQRSRKLLKKRLMSV